MDRKELFTRLRPTIAFVLPLILVVALAGVLRFRDQNRPVVFFVEMPATIVVEPGQTTVSVDITLRLENRRDHDIDLVANNDCDIFRWFVVDRTGSFVQSQFVDACGDFPVAEALRGEGTLVRPITLTMNATRLTPGSRYDLVMQFWGYEARERFRVVEPAGDE